MSELDVLLGELVPMFDAAVRAYGTGVLTRGESAAVDATASLGRQALRRIVHRARKPAAVAEAVADLAADPADPDTLAALRLQIRKVLVEDMELLREVAALLPGRASGAGPANRSVAVAGDNVGPITTGDGSPILHIRSGG